MSGASISITGLTKSYRSHRVLDRVDIEVAAGSLTCLLGPSGSGKSTVLGCVSGLVEPDAGIVRLDGRDMSGVPPHRRPVTMVLQQPQLFPFLSVLDNVAFGLRARRVAKSERLRAARASLDLVGLGADDLDADRSIDGLSGGEAQRVSLARALCVDPSVLLLDEPLASLDPPIRRSLQDLLAEIHDRSSTTMVLVTHDRSEALSLCDHLVILDAGRTDAAGPPHVLFDRPPTRATAELLGVENLLDGARFGHPGTTVAIRPETVRVSGSPTGEWTVRRHRYLGPTTEVMVRHTHGDRHDDGDHPFDVIASLPTADAPPVGATVDVDFATASKVVLPG